MLDCNERTVNLLAVKKSLTFKLWFISFSLIKARKNTFLAFGRISKISQFTLQINMSSKHRQLRTQKKLAFFLIFGQKSNERGNVKLNSSENNFERLRSPILWHAWLQ